MGISKHNFLILFIALFIGGSFYVPNNKNETNIINTINVKEEKRASTKVKVGYFSLSSFQDYDEVKNVYSGYSYEYYLALSQYAAWEYEFIPGTYQELQQKLENNEIDILNYQTYGKNENFAYSSLAAGENCYYIATLNENISFEEWSEIKKLKIGLVKDSDYYEPFLQYCRINNFEPKENENIFFYDSYSLVTQAYEKGEIDAGIISSMQNIQCNVVGTFAPQKFYFAVNKNNTNLLNELNKAQNSLLSYNGNFANDLKNKYYSDKIAYSSLSFTEEEEKYIKEHRNVKVCYDATWKPLQSRNKDGNFEGAIADLYSLLAKRTGLNFEYVTDDDFGNVIDMITNGEADIISEIAYDFINASKKNVYLTNPFMNISIIKATSKKTNNEIIALPKDYYLSSYLKDYLGDNVIIDDSYANTNDALQAVISGKAGTTYLNEYEYLYYSKRSTYTNNLMFSSAYGINYELCIAVSRSADPLLFSIMNKAITSIPDSEISEILSNTSLYYAENSLLDFLAANLSVTLSIMSVIIILITCLCVVILIVNRKRKERNILLQKTSNQLQFLAQHDYLTKLPNKSQFNGDAEKLLLDKIPFSVIIIDIDNFKYFNDLFGHNAGDKLLIEISNKFIGMSDDKLKVYRYAGDEFVVVYKTIIYNEVKDACYKLQSITKSKIDLGESKVSFSFSMGVSRYPEDGENINTLIFRADSAMYSIKEKNKNAFAFFDNSLEKDYHLTTLIHNELINAISDKRIYMVFQPLYKVENKEIIGFECLMRIKDSQFMPGQFIPVAEKTGLMKVLGRIALEQACVFLSEMREKTDNLPEMFVNFSAKQLTDNDYIMFVRNTLSRYNIPADRITFELTESLLFENKEIVNTLAQRAVMSGIKLALDDFGSGYSSINYLTRFKFDIIKLDKFIISSLPEHAEQVKNLIDFIHTFSYSVLAEGVETDEQFEFLKNNNCDYFQGFYLSKPLDVNDAIELYLNEIKNKA